MCGFGAHHLSSLYISSSSRCRNLGEEHGLLADLLTEYTLLWNLSACHFSLTKFYLEFNDNSMFFPSWEICVSSVVFPCLVMRFWKIKCIVGMYPSS